jgi:CRP-like cAMP-binding protein
MEGIAAFRRWGRDQEIYRRGDPVQCWFRLETGVARKSTLLGDGRRRIVDFLFPGDFFGISSRRYREFDVTAVTGNTLVACYPCHRLEALANSHPEVGRRLRELAADSIARLQERILVLGHVTAPAKVSAFLLEMAERSCGDSAAVILPMSRYDIADYLAISVETVSRALTDLRHRKVIRLPSKHEVTIIDLAMLADET